MVAGFQSIQNCQIMRVAFRQVWFWVLLISLCVSAKGTAAAPLQVEPERAMSDAPIQVRLVNPPDAVRVRFTTDGTEPTPANGQDYAAPWSFTRTTILKVAAFANGQATSPATTHTYLILDDILRQPAKPKGVPYGDSAWQGEPSYYAMDQRVVLDPRYRDRMKAALRSLPSVSLVCSPQDLWGEDRGLYLNSTERGDGWERRCSLEWIETNGVIGFQIDCGFRMQGNTGRMPDKTPKHSFRVLFKKPYGPTKLRYRVFPDSTATQFDSLVLRADYNNAWTHWKAEDNERAQRIRDAWMKDSHRAMGSPAAHNRYVHLYLNGLYWGIYDVAERPDASFAAAYFGGEREDYDVLDDSGVKSGSPESIRDLRRWSRAAPGMLFETAGARVDLPQFMDYLLLNYYAGNQDWGEQQNWYAIRRHGPDERFRYYVWDGEITLQSLNDDIVNRPRRPPMSLARHLAKDPEYRLAFADRVQAHCFGSGALTPEASASRWRQRGRELELPLLAESARWGYCRRNPPFTLEDWFVERDRLLGHYFPKRTQVLLRQLRSAGLYPEVPAPSLQWEPSPANASAVRVTLGTNVLAGTLVYLTTDGADPRVPRLNTASASAQVWPPELIIKSPVTIKARALSGTNWSALVQAAIPGG